MKPQLVVETGTEKGLGSLVLAEALIQNGSGRLITVDMEPSSGLLIGAKYDGVIQRLIKLICLFTTPTTALNMKLKNLSYCNHVCQ
jgi:cephalosporin hydroxylase